MPSSSATLSALDAYQLRLPTFEGPLDVLLRLIEREQLAISEVSLLAVLDQFMAFMHTLDSTPPSVVAEFAAVAGRLSVLKSRALLPRPAKAIEDPDEMDLVRQLEEYRSLKAAAEVLAERHLAGLGTFAAGEAISRPQPTPRRLVPQPAASISRAVTRWLTRLPTKPTPISPRRVVTLREMISRIYSVLDGGRTATFDAVCSSGSTRQEVAVAFLAVLTLVRRRAVVASQEGLFTPIRLTRSTHAGAVEPLHLAPQDDEPEQLPA